MKLEETQPWVTKAKAPRQSHPSQSEVFKPRLGPAQTHFPNKIAGCLMSQFQATWAKGRAILKQFAGKALGLS